MFTVARKINNQYESVVRFESLKQAREWAPNNGHSLVTGKDARAALRSGAVVRRINSAGRVVW